MAVFQAIAIERTEDMDSTKRTARIAGFIYLLLVITSVLNHMYLAPTFIVPGDAAATANNITSSELLFRTSIVDSLISQVIFVFLVLALYRLFKAVGHMPALLMVTLVVISASTGFLNTFNKIAALIALSGADFLSVFEKPELDALAYLFLRLHAQSVQAIQLFWGLWLFPFGLLVYRSRFIPRILGVLLVIAGFAYLLNGFTSLLLPQYRGIVSQITMPLMFGELPIVFWLLIVGARAQSSEEPTPSAP